ncbi:MAG: DUF481 domain-containing protein, partial [Longimicrobiales bacterium]
QKTDILVLRNGDRITGEVSGLTRGLLSYKTDDAGTLRVEWDKIVSLTSVHLFEVELVTDRKVYGTLSEGPQPGTILIAGELFPLIAVVSITEISPTFIERTAGYVDLGWTLAKANRAHTTTFGAEARYRGELLGIRAGLSAYEQGQEGSETTRNASVGLDVNRFFGPLWAARFFGEASMDDALGLDLRTLVGGGMRRRLAHTNRLDASASAGLVGSRENYSDQAGSTHSLEILLAADFAAFRLDSPELDATVVLKTFTSLTESNRYRTDVDTRVRYEIFGDFFIQLSLKASYDTNPPSSEDAEKSSFNSGLSVGWSW